MTGDGKIAEAERRAERKAAGLCVRCGGPSGDVAFVIVLADPGANDPPAVLAGLRVYRAVVDGSALPLAPIVAREREPLSLCLSCRSKFWKSRAESRWRRYMGRMGRLIERDGSNCAWCGRPLGNEWGALSIDHIRPRANGGGDDAGNLQVLHALCNSAKGERPMSARPLG